MDLDEPTVPAALDPLGIAKAATEVWQAMALRPDSLFSAQMRLASDLVGLATQTAVPPPKAVGDDTSAAVKAKPLIEPAPNDSRFRHKMWSDNATFDAIKQAYLLATKAVLESVDRAEGVDDATRARVKFFAKQFCDAMSPTNFPFLNPAVLEEAVKSKGENFQRGLQHLLEDARENHGRPALVDKTKFTIGGNVAASAGAVVYRNELIELIQYAPTTETVFERPLVITPPWINKFYILDLRPDNSLIKYATDAGFTVFVISWRNPDGSLRDYGWEEYMELGPLTAARVASSITGSIDVNLIGYCIGGTLTATMLAYLAKTEERLVNAVTFFAALVDFSDVGDIKNFINETSLQAIEKKMESHGVLGAAEMADTFTLLRSNDLIWNVAVNRYLLGKDAPAFDLLFWNDDATRLPAKMHSYYLRNMYLENKLREPDALRIRDVPIDVRRIRNDIYSVASIEDHIAPWRSVFQMTQLFASDAQFRLGFSGHIAGIINSPSSRKGHYWKGPVTKGQEADDWFAGATRHAGSWWPDWQAWLAERSGERVAAKQKLGSRRFAPLGPAPGTYVLVRA